LSCFLAFQKPVANLKKPQVASVQKKTQESDSSDSDRRSMAGDYSETQTILYLSDFCFLLLEAILLYLLDNFDNRCTIFNIWSYEVIS